MKILNIIRAAKKISIIKTIWINYKLFKGKEIFKFQILIGKNVIIKNLGDLIITDIKSGRIHIGTSPLFNASNAYPIILNNNGTLYIGGNSIIQPGVTIYTTSNAYIKLCGNNRIGAHTQLLSRKGITIGYNTGISWNCQLCDSDFHYIRNTETNNVLPNTKEIIIDDYVWIGNHVIIAKGVQISSGCIIGQNSYVNKSINQSNKIIVGSPAKMLDGTYERIWDLDKENELMKDF